MARQSWTLLRSSAGVAAASCMAWTGATLAADAEPRLEEIIVTAQKEASNLQDTPISITAITAETLEKRGYSNISEIAAGTPNLQFNATAPVSGSSNASSIFIRGVGQTDFLLTTDPGVGIYLDGVYIARSVGSLLDTADIERVEVLRGPQGTLFGKNTIGGAINVTSLQPSNTLGASAELITGSYDRLDVRASASLPLSDNLFLRLSGVSRNRDGYGERILTGQHLGNQSSNGARGTLRWLPGENTELNLSFDGSRTREESPVATAGPSGVGPPGVGALTNLYNAFVAPTKVIPGFGTGVLYDDRWITGDPYKTFGTGPTSSDSDIWGSALIIEHTFGGVKLKSISSYRHMKANFARDFDNSPLEILSTSDVIGHEQWSQELNLSGRALQDKLKWLVGVYYFGEKGSDRIVVPVVPDLFPALGIPASVSGEYTIDNEHYAGFVQATYSLTDQLSFTAGGRYSEEKRRFHIDYFATDINLRLVADPDAELTFNNFTPRLGIDYKLNDGVLVYGSYTEGFKAGGFVARYVAPAASPRPFDPEEVRTFEIGIKSDLLDRRLRLNASAFTSDYKNIQVVAFQGVAPVNVNAAAGRIKGFELEATALPMRGLQLSAGVGYLDAEYTSIDAANFVGITFPITLQSEFVNTPEWSANSTIVYTFPLGSAGDLSLQGSWAYQAKTFKDASNTPGLSQDGFSLFDARIAFTTADGKWTAALFGKNLSDKVYLTSGVSDVASFGTVEANYAPPREWGASIKYGF